MKYVQNIRGKWCVRIKIPDELIPIIGKRELSETNLPSEPRSREKLAHGIINRFLMQIDEARERLESQQCATELAQSTAAKAHYANTLAADDAKRTAMPTQGVLAAEHERILQKVENGEIGASQGPLAMINASTDYELMLGARDFYRKNRTRRLAALRASFVSGETRWIEPAVHKYVTDNKLDLAAGSPGWHDLANALMRAEIEALEHTLERDQGDYSGKPRDPLLTAPDPEPETTPAKPMVANGTTLSDILSAFHKERTAGGNTLAPKTMDEDRNAVRMFSEFIGGEVGVRAITKKNVIDYKRALLETPNRYTMRFPGLTLPQAIKANAKLAEPFATLAPKTINMKWLSHLSSMLQWASNNGHIETNPAQGIRVDTGSRVHQQASYLPFTKDELQTIFGDPIFADPASYGMKQWAVLIMLYTGVRNSSAMARMPLANIYEEQGVPVFFLADASKNQRSKRMVPIHDDLIRLGFLDHVEGLRESGEYLLFPAWAKRSDKVRQGQ